MDGIKGSKKSHNTFTAFLALPCLFCCAPYICFIHHSSSSCSCLLWMCRRYPLSLRCESGGVLQPSIIKAIKRPPHRLRCLTPAAGADSEVVASQTHLSGSPPSRVLSTIFSRYVLASQPLWCQRGLQTELRAPLCWRYSLPLWNTDQCFQREF